MEPCVEPGHEPGLLWRPHGCLFLFFGKSWFEPGFLAQFDRERERKTQEWLEAEKASPSRRARTCGSDAIARGSVSGLLETFSVVIPVVSLHA